MTQLTIIYPLPHDAGEVQDGRLTVTVGNGVRLLSAVPQWVKGVSDVKLQIVLEAEGTPDAKPDQSPVE